MRFIECGENDPLEYFPLKDGLKPTQMGLKKLPNYDLEKKNNIFQFDNKFSLFRELKVLQRSENLKMYYQNNGRLDLKPVIEHIVRTLLLEHPDKFSLENNKLHCHLTNETLFFSNDFKLTHQITNLSVPYVDAFDALSSQVQEDLVVHTLFGEDDFTSVAHLFSPNGWSAEWAINQSFKFIHEGVSKIDKVVPRPHQMLRGLIQSGYVFERVAAINFRTDTKLNRHPEIKIDEPFCPANPKLFMRFERQTTTGFKDINSFLFTIRTYFVDCDQRLKDKEKHAQIVRALREAHEDANANKFLRANKENVLKWLEG